MPRKNLGKYEIIDRIGRGGMAEVYRGYHPALDRYVAIKLLHPFLADDPEFKDRFENEARNVAKLKHPNIVQVYDFEYDSEGESYYMVMELINGPTLKDRLFDLASTGERVSLPEAIRIIKSAAEALAYAHQRNMIHRDVKPANLMIDEDKRVVLTDFGIAKIVTGAQFTASGGMVGTPAYMAPEQGLGEAGDERSDIYSLGVILYQLITGRLPFDADTPLAIILKHLNEPLPVPHSFFPAIPEDLERIICKALAKDPEERYQSALDLASDLARLDDTGHRLVPFDTPTGQLGALPTTHETAPAATAAQRARLAGGADATTPVPEAAHKGVPGRLHPFGVLGLVISLLVVIGAALVLFGSDNTFVSKWLEPGHQHQTQTALALLFNPSATSSPTQTFTSTPTTQVATAVESPSPEVTLSYTPTWTLTPSLTPSLTPTFTPTWTLTPSLTPSPTLTLTLTPSLTPSPNLTGTALAAFYETEAAASPTPNMTQTIAACDFGFIVVQPERYAQPPSISDSTNPRLVHFNQDFSFQIVFRNTGSCSWPRGARLTYNAKLTANPGESVNLTPLQSVCTAEEIRGGINFATQEQSNFYLDDEVGITEESAPLTFTGTAPSLYGCYYGVWDLLYPNSSVPIGHPLVLTIRVWGSG